MPFELALVDRTVGGAQVARLPAAQSERADPGARSTASWCSTRARRSACTSSTRMPQAGLAPALGTRRTRALLQVAGLAHQHAAGEPDRLLLPGALGRRGRRDRAGEGARRGARSARCSISSTPQLARHGGPWLLGADYSAADAYAFMLCRWTRGFAPAGARPAAARPLPAAPAGAAGGAARARARAAAPRPSSDRRGRRRRPGRDYSARVSPEPPISFGRSCIFGRPSFIGRRVSW